jgi:hypothetical protein
VPSHVNLPVVPKGRERGIQKMNDHVGSRTFLSHRCTRSPDGAFDSSTRPIQTALSVLTSWSFGKRGTSESYLGAPNALLAPNPDASRADRVTLLWWLTFNHSDLWVNLVAAHSFQRPGPQGFPRARLWSKPCTNESEQARRTRKSAA